MQDVYQLREAGSEDASALAALSIEVWLSTYAEEGVSKTYGDHLMATFTKDTFLRDLQDQHVRIVVCHRGDFLLGYVKVLLSTKPPLPGCGTAEISTIYVRNHHKGAGIGTALLKRAYAIGREHGHDVMFLTVNHQNLPAIEFYKSRGMVCLGEWIYRLKDIAVMNYVYASRTA